MALEFAETSNHRIIEQLKKIGYDFNWQNEDPLIMPALIQ
jgi:valyl-tRNA synthetase